MYPEISWPLAFLSRMKMMDCEGGGGEKIVAPNEVQHQCGLRTH